MAHPTIQELSGKARAKPWQTIGIVLAAIALIVYGVVSHIQHRQQLISDDVNRVQDFAEIESNTEKYFMEHDLLPDDLGQVSGDEHPNPNFVRDDYLFDPATHRLHEYSILNVRSYQLCANFNFSYRKEPGAVPLGVDENSIWRHEAGHQCFKFFVTRDPKAQ